MKKSLVIILALASMGAPVWAADLAPSYKAPPMAPVALYDWAGFYVGGHVGGGSAIDNDTELAPGNAPFPAGTAISTYHASGFLGGVQGGYNWQASNNLVLGVEGEYSWADLSGIATTVSVVPGFLNGFSTTDTVKLKDVALATGRLGYAANNWLFFVKGGGAWGHGSSRGNDFLANGTFADNPSSNSSRTGWVVGGGIEWGFAPNWSAKIEYNHVDFGSRTVAINTTLGTTFTSFLSSTDRTDLVKAGVNYRFNLGGR